MNQAAPDVAAVWQTLASIPDPEFGVNIVDLGLIYSVECAGRNVKVVMTLTTPTCPSGTWILEGAEAAVRQLPGVESVRVELVFEPPWDSSMLSASALRQLG